jgi:fructosamine-3-kinase
MVENSAPPTPLWLAAALRVGGLPGPHRILRDLSGGCINRACAVETGAGKVLVKSNASAPPDFFLREREGLEALAAARSSLVIPKVLALHMPDTGVGPAALVLEWLEPAAPDPGMWEELGRGLAALHRVTSGRYGFGADNYMGATPQPNGWMEGWGSFVVERRIGHLTRLLAGAGALAPEARRTYDRLLERIPGLLDHRPAPSLLHGDLWRGNFLATTRGPAVIDPAVYHGDRETDLAMMRLFGGFPETVFDAYREVWPLPDGWKEREPFYRLYHLLNHQLLFGGPYGAEALAIAKRMA